MTPRSKLKTLTLDDNLAQSIDEMEKYNIRHIPILEGQTIVGVESIRGVT
jgi:CBS domain-containing protein